MNVFEQALLNTLMGMGTVFAVLIFISLLISLFVYIPSIERALKNRSSRKEKRAAQEERPAPKRPIIEEAAEEEEELVDDGELVAVITAAIMAASSGTAVSADKLVVRSIKRVKRR
ncbi:malate dehydrogenase (oxaloacetate-decarboxylating) [Anaerobutyricum hallii]|uniref:Malate dehydrogenase (Oxaloacetate-decarboxylating) n=1 Tax=Anaerobutyricum hallii TaxID=39488 RepID=A0A285PSX2_9FIRM|nr:OadG family protein [Anaerobutyricum hallii]SOB72718.1 malate dehydrogenase (oxaloacetate-decarboxylating) [Anaerobutyricum hallii]